MEKTNYVFCGFGEISSETFQRLSVDQPPIVIMSKAVELLL